MMALVVAMVLLAGVALIVARIAASPLVRCVCLCFDSWAEASRPEPSGRT